MEAQPSKPNQALFPMENENSLLVFFLENTLMPK